MERGGEVHYPETLMSEESWGYFEMWDGMGAAVDEVFEETAAVESSTEEQAKELTLEEKVSSFIHNNDCENKVVINDEKDKKIVKKTLAAIAGDEIRYDPDKLERFQTVQQALNPKIDFSDEERSYVYGRDIEKTFIGAKALYKLAHDAEEERAPWTAQSNCIDKKYSNFYPAPGLTRGERQAVVKKALETCLSCEVKVQCRNYAKSQGLDREDGGVKVIGGKAYGLDKRDAMSLNISS